MCHHPLILSSELYDPLSLEVTLKRSRSNLGLVRHVTLQVSLKQAALMMQLKKGASLYSSDRSNCGRTRDM